ncbi:MAG: phage tail protein [Rhodobacterales bacterium 17-64-5]|nr:MAG: phage tail protein [Rhodobacterales bacterium 17-64-5]
MTDLQDPFAPHNWYRADRGPRYTQLYRHIAALIRSGALEAEAQLPPERDLADLADVSRVTVRKAVAQLVEEGALEQRRGAGTFVRPQPQRLEQSLSNLISFSEHMHQRGKTASSSVLQRGLFPPRPEEQMALGLPSGQRVARVERLRSADGQAMALEWSSLPEDILPDPFLVETSLYSVLRDLGCAPVRAVQRVTAVNLEPGEAQLLNLAPGSAVLRIDRTGYLASGRPIEFTRGLYRSDIYDFIAESR